MLELYSIGSSLTVTGVDLLMESKGLGISASNPVTNLHPLTNDEFGTRQFLYPFLAPVPEPSTLLLTFVGLLLVVAKVGRGRSQLKKA